MGCNMMGGEGAAAAWAQNNAARASDAADQALKRCVQLELRVAELEQALCGLCQSAFNGKRLGDTELAAWFERHKAKPGCDL